MTKTTMHILLGLAATLAAAAPVTAGELSAINTKNELLKVDTQSGVATLVGPYTLGPNEPAMTHIARHTDGTLYGVSTSKIAAAVYRLDDVTGAATNVHVTTPVSSIGAAVDPTDGSFWFANTAGFVWWPALVRVDLVTGVESYPGNIAPTGDNYTGMAFDPNGQLYCLNISQNALWRVDKVNPANSVMVGTGLGNPGLDITFGATLTWDGTTGQLLGHAVSGSKLFTVDPNSGLAGLLSPANNLPKEITAVADGPNSGQCGAVLKYGQGCPGMGGFIPNYTWSGCAAAGQPVSLTVANGLGGATAMILFGLGQTQTPIGGGCDLLVAPVLPAMLFVPMGGIGPGAGSVTLGGALPASASGAQFTTQAFVLDGSNGIGGAAGNALDVTVL